MENKPADCRRSILDIPVVHENVCHAQTSDQETSRPLCLEADGDHDTGAQPDEGDQKTENAELSLEDESDEQEDEKDTACQLEAEARVGQQAVTTEWLEILTISACHSR